MVQPNDRPRSRTRRPSKKAEEAEQHPSKKRRSRKKSSTSTAADEAPITAPVDDKKTPAFTKNELRNTPIFARLFPNEKGVLQIKEESYAMRCHGSTRIEMDLLLSSTLEDVKHSLDNLFKHKIERRLTDRVGNGIVLFCRNDPQERIFGNNKTKQLIGLDEEQDWKRAIMDIALKCREEGGQPIIFLDLSEDGHPSKTTLKIKLLGPRMAELSKPNSDGIQTANAACASKLWIPTIFFSHRGSKRM